MRLLEIKEDGTLAFTDMLYSNLPPYAVLSHTWGRDADEVTYKDMLKGRARQKLGYKKIELCADWAKFNNLRHIWVDTCCIDKRDSNEIQEAVNSMFTWYQKSAMCYVYLADVSSLPAVITDANPQSSSYTYDRSISLASLRKSESRWFTRGWTLQELLAPSIVHFYSAEGAFLGNRVDLQPWIHEVTGIHTDALAGKDLRQFSVPDRLAWAATRETKRPEDKAYCLLGIFGVHMPLLYGEGQEGAFHRLEREVVRQVQSQPGSWWRRLLEQRDIRLKQMSSRKRSRSDASERTRKQMRTEPASPVARALPQSFGDNTPDFRFYEDFTAWLFSDLNDQPGNPSNENSPFSMPPPAPLILPTESPHLTNKLQSNPVESEAAAHTAHHPFQQESPSYRTPFAMADDFTALLFNDPSLPSPAYSSYPNGTPVPPPIFPSPGSAANSLTPSTHSSNMLRYMDVVKRQETSATDQKRDLDSEKVERLREPGDSKGVTDSNPFGLGPGATENDENTAVHLEAGFLQTNDAGHQEAAKTPE